MRHGFVTDTSVATSLVVDSVRTTPTPLAYHFFSVPGSSSDHSFVITQSVNLPYGTVTDSPTATTWPMSSAWPGPYSCRYGAPGLGWPGMMIPGWFLPTPASHDPSVSTLPPGPNSFVSSPK